MIFSIMTLNVRLVLAAALLLPSLSVAQDLPTCELDTEIQFFTAEFDVLDLPEACYDEKHLTTLGFLIQVQCPCKRPESFSFYLYSQYCFPATLSSGCGF